MVNCTISQFQKSHLEHKKQKTDAQQLKKKVYAAL